MIEKDLRKVIDAADQLLIAKNKAEEIGIYDYINGFQISNTLFQRMFNMKGMYKIELFNEDFEFKYTAELGEYTYFTITDEFLFEGDEEEEI